MTPPPETTPPVTIHVNGRALRVGRGLHLAAALWADGRRVLSRSMRYHRARGLFCGTGECTHCFVRVDGVPNVRACQVPCHEGMWVEDQNAWPSARFDALAAADLAFPDYLDAHTSFIRPRLLKPVYDRIIRGMAGFGKIPREPVAQRYDARRTSADVLVVGAGPAGLSAAEAAAKAGARVVLVDRAGGLGGRLAWTRRPDADGTDAALWIDERRRALEAEGVETHRNTRLLGVYVDEGLVAATPSAVLRIEAPALVVATGARDAYLPFAGSDRAGVMLAAAAHRTLALDGVLVGRRPVILGTTPQAVALAADLREAGASIDSLWEPRDEPGAGGARAARLGLGIHLGHRPVAASGRAAFRKIRFETDGGATEARGDVLVHATGRVARSELAQQAGCRLAWRPGFGFAVGVDDDGRTDRPGVFAAGSVAAAADWRAAADGGRRAGLAAAEAAR